MTQIEKLIESFKHAKKAGTTEETQRFYRDHLKPVEQWINDIGLTDINDITADMVDDFIGDMKDAGLSQKTLNNRLGIIKQLIKLRLLPYEYTKEQNIIMEKIKARPTDPDHYPALTREQFKKFIEYVSELDESKPQQLKRKIAFLLFIGSGARNSEVRNIRIEDIDYDHKRIYLNHTKCHDGRHILLDNRAIELLKKHIKLNKPETYIIQNEMSKGVMSRTMVQKYFLEATAKLGFHVCTHILRATFITMMIEDGTSLGFVMQLAGHKHLSTTERYLHMVDKRIADEYEIHNPIAQLDRDGWIPSALVKNVFDSMMIDSDKIEVRA